MPWLQLALAAIPAIFGGGGGGSSGVDIEMEPSLSPEQREMMMAALGPILDGLQPQAYTGDLVAGLTGMQRDAMGFARSLLGQGLSPQFGDEQGSMQRALQRALTGGATVEGGMEAAQRMFEDSVAAPAMRQFQEQLLPSIREGSIESGNFWSSMRQQQELDAAENLAASLAGTQAQILHGEHQAQRASQEAGLDRMMQGVQQAMGLRGMALDHSIADRQSRYQGIDLVSQLGAQEQATEQARLDASYNEWLRQQAANLPYLDMVMRFLGTPQQVAYQPGQDIDPLAQLLGIASDIYTGWQKGQTG